MEMGMEVYFIIGGIVLVLGALFYFLRNSDSELTLYATKSSSTTAKTSVTGDFSAVVVTFTSIELKPEDKDSIMIEMPEPRMVNFLALDENMALLLDGQEVPSGKYEWMRLKLKTAKDSLDSYVEKDGEQFPLWVPSGAASGLKLTKGFVVPENDNANFAVAFNVETSLKEPTGLGEAYIMRPTLKLIDNYKPEEDPEIDPEV